MENSYTELLEELALVNSSARELLEKFDGTQEELEDKSAEVLKAIEDEKAGLDDKSAEILKAIEDEKAVLDDKSAEILKAIEDESAELGNSFAAIGGLDSQRFKVATAQADDEAVNKKQLEDKLASLDSIPVGTILIYPIDNVPTIAIECNGSELSRTIFSNLFAVIGTTYGEGDGTTTFNIPDLRGEFIRGWDNGRGADSGRNIGSKQLGTLVGGEADGNYGNTFSVGISSADPTLSNTRDVLDTAEYSTNLKQGYRSHAIATSLNSSYCGISRPRNIAMMYCIKY